ncbi:MAG: TraM recognition domain-containing protein [Bacteroidota bacterium]
MSKIHIMHDSNNDNYFLDLTGRITDLETPILRFNLSVHQEVNKDVWTLRDAVRGIQIFGGIGSGKSSGSGATIARSYLKAGFGGIVYTSKIDEVDRWREYAKEEGREDELIVFEDGSPLQANPLAIEAARKGKIDAMTLTNLFMEMHEVVESYSAGGKSGGSNDQFWDRTVKRFINNAINLLLLAKEEVSVMNLRRILVSALTKEELEAYNQLRHEFQMSEEGTERDNLKEQLDAFMNAHYGLQTLSKASAHLSSAEDEERYGFVKEYFLKMFPRLPQKTRAIVEESIYGLIEPFMNGVLRRHFSEGVSEDLLPENTFKKGSIIVINFPVKEYGIAGLLAQSIYKRRWQEAVERRDIDEYPLPVFQWIDEAQYFLNEKDAEFQTTARSSRACTVYITQNISNYYAVIGGSNPRDRVNSLLGNLATKIFHTNNDYVTNNWASDTIGKTFQAQYSMNMNMENVNGSTNMSKSLQYQIEPQQFTILKGGGSENDFLVEAVITVAGKQWSNGKNFIMTTFDQNFKA